MSVVDLEIREFPEHPMLGRKIAVLDARSRQFAAIGSIVSDTREPRTKTWATYPRAFDQGMTSQCTCYSGKRIINAAPLRSTIPSASRLNLDPTPLYRWAQDHDEWEGNDYDGTSVLAAAKAYRHHGFTNGYRWCFGLEDVLRTVSWYGPVGIGVTWYDSMFDTRADGTLVVDFSSAVAGGHAVTIIGNDVVRKRVIISNSWGTGWGDRGRCYMSWADLGTLLEDWGEAVTYL